MELPDANRCGECEALLPQGETLCEPCQLLELNPRYVTLD